MSEMTIEDLVRRAAVIANNATVCLTALAGPGAAERVLTALILAYAEQLGALRGPARAGEILYACADSVATGEAVVLGQAS